MRYQDNNISLRPSQQQQQQQQQQQRPSRSLARQLFSPLSFLTHLVVGVSAFHAGFTVGTGACPEDTSEEEFLTNLLNAPKVVAESASVQNELFTDSIRDVFVAGVRVPRADFIDQFDIGVPWDEPRRGAKDVVILYGSQNSLPDGYHNGSTRFMKDGTISVDEATRNCNSLKAILVKPGDDNHQPCLALTPQWESFHVHKFMRLKPDEDNSKETQIFSPDYPLRYVSRRHEESGKKSQFPLSHQTTKWWSMLIDYLQKLEGTLDRLKPLAKRAAGRDNTVVVMVCNFGQSELLMNFVCSQRARGLDISKIVLFATDKDIADLASSLGVTVFEVGDAFGDMPKDAARVYGDRRFQGMMMSKVYCVHLINALGYDVLFQDVDVIWYKDPIKFFHGPEAGDFDFYFQDDGAHSSRYIPYSPNSGFYYVRNNERTKYFFEVFIRMGELIIASGSHQSVLNGLLADQASSRGLRVKVYQRDSELGRSLPGGFHFHKRKNFMKEVLQGERKPYIFHMSWTENKDDKQRFYQQMGDWYLEDKCAGKPFGEFSATVQKDVTGQCCSAKPLFVCHYRDKPSKKPCKDSPPIDANARSFW